MLAAFAVLALAGCTGRTSMEPIHLTQCFASFEFDQNFSRKAEFYKDDERRCYGQRWVIPRAYYGSHHVAYNPDVVALVLEVGRPDIIPNITKMTPGKLLPRDAPPLYKEVKIIPLFTGTFTKRLNEVKQARQSTGWKKSNTLLFGMEVYDLQRNPERFPRDVLLFARGDNPPYFINCIVNPDDPPQVIQTAPKGGCTITSDVDDRVYLEYYINKSALPQLQVINAELASLIRSFMIN